MSASYLIITPSQPVRFNLAAIMRAAWEGYRLAVRSRWVAAGKMDAARMSYELGMASSNIPTPIRCRSTLSAATCRRNSKP
jgi:hypothetical protein